MFWAQVWRDVVETTLRLNAMFTGTQYASYESRVSMSLPLDVDTADIAAAMKAVNESAAALTLDYGTAQRANSALLALLLADLNVNEVQEIVMPETTEAALMLPTHLHESHKPVMVYHTCPLCGAGEAHSYAGHGPLLVCAECGKTYDPTIE